MTSIGNWLDLSSTSNLLNKSYVQGFVDVSGGNVILRNNANLFITGGDASLGGRLFVTRDVSLNGNVSAGGIIRSINLPRLLFNKSKY